MTKNAEPQLGRFANVKLDTAFKRAFSRKRLLLLFLNELIPERDIADLSYTPQEMVNPFPGMKDIRVDVECIDKQGRRCLLLPRRLFHRHTRLYPPPGRPEHFQMLFLELPKCSPGPNAGKLEKFGYLMENLEKWDEVPEGFDDELFQLLLESAEIIKFTPAEKVKYEKDMTTERDIQNQIDYAHMTGVQEGRAEGLAEGEAKGIEKGIEKGAREEKVSIARAMLAEGEPTHKVSLYTGLSADEIRQLT